MRIKIPDSKIFEAARKISNILMLNGEAYYVGGAVRDLILGRPIKDVDIATSLSPVVVNTLLKESGIRNVNLVGVQFGCVKVSVDDAEIDIATFRNDIYIDGAFDGRHPASIDTEATVMEDAARRDFSINALYVHPITGTVFDFVGGLKDIEKGVIAAIGNPIERFKEDRLRMLRAIRFSAQLGFSISGPTQDAIAMMGEGITQVSKERIADEIKKILMSSKPSIAFRYLYNTGMITDIIPGFKVLMACMQSPDHHPEGDVFTHTMMMIDMAAESGADLTTRLGCLFHDIGKPDTQTIDPDGRIRFNGHAEIGANKTETVLKDLKFDNETIENVVGLVADHMQFIDLKNMGRGKRKKFLARNQIERHFELHRIDALCSSGDLSSYELGKQLQAEMPPEVIKPKPLIGGRDLMAIGVAPGPFMGHILRIISEEQLEGLVNTYEEAVERAAQIVRESCQT